MFLLLNKLFFFFYLMKIMAQEFFKILSCGEFFLSQLSTLQKIFILYHEKTF